MKSPALSTHSSVETSAAMVIQAWLRGHRSRRETSDVWLSYLSSVKECEGQTTETKIQLPLLKHAELRAKFTKQTGSKDAAPCKKEKINPYSICTAQKDRKLHNNRS